jgi:hypothetical protein|tara:strand:- start:89 stop:469 length:381 start_codon:yes stop_codon:yes gene_type:complete
MKIIDKLTTYASLIGVIGAIGGGFYAWGEFNTRLSNMENRPVADVSSVSKEVSEIRVELAEKITAIEDKLESQADQDLSVISGDIKELKDSMSKALKDIEINKKVNELQDSKIEQVRIKATNPLAN